MLCGVGLNGVKDGFKCSLIFRLRRNQLGIKAHDCAEHAGKQYLTITDEQDAQCVKLVGCSLSDAFNRFNGSPVSLRYSSVG